jgi:hypothetical protein
LPTAALVADVSIYKELDGVPPSNKRPLISRNEKERMMLSPKHKRYADRIRELIEEGQGVAGLERPSSVGPFIQDKVPLYAWLVKVNNILETVFGPQSPHMHHFQELAKDRGRIAHSYKVNSIVGVLTGALDDLEKGYLLGQEFLVAGEVFDSILEQAKYLNQNGHKDPAAVLARVVLEDALKRIVRGEGLDDNQSASRLNDELRGINKYPKPQWRLIQAWLDIGNAAAHGKFNEYNEGDVKGLIEDIEQFLAVEFRR